MSLKRIYKAEYAKSNRSKCKGENCTTREILKDALRLVYISKSLKHDGDFAINFHPECFFNEYYPESESEIDGFANLLNYDQNLLRQYIDLHTSGSSKRSRKRKHEPDDEEDSNPPSKIFKQLEIHSEDDELDIIIYNQNEKFHALRTIIKNNIDSKWQELILKDNGQVVPKNKNEMLDHVTDVIFFGAIEACSQQGCKKGGFVFDGNSTYRCVGHLSGFGECQKISNKPQRRPVQIYNELRGSHPFLNVEFHVQNRAVKENATFSGVSHVSFYEMGAKLYQFLYRGEKIIIKDGVIVDSRSNLQSVAHVFTECDKKYSVILNKVNLHNDKNSYYKLQLLESDEEDPKKYWVSRSFGRIGTAIGGNTTKESVDFSLEDAKKSFCKIFTQKTGNDFLAAEFEKKIEKYNLVMTSDEEIKRAYELAQSSSLPKPVEDLLKLFVDMDRMENVMVEFHLDAVKSPLVKIEEMHIHKAEFILKELDQRIKHMEPRSYLEEVSNRFYSLIPHSVNAESVIDTKGALIKKLNMLKSLKEMQFTFKLLYKDTGEEAKNLLDSFYKQFDVQIEPVEKSSNEFANIRNYADNGRENYDFEIEEIYRIERSGEESRYESFKKLSHRTLLWHGSRIIRFPSILAQGLTMESAQSGLFGKGLYFADVFTKASYFCHANESDKTGLLLLCEVALGESHQCFEPKNIEILPDNYHSVQGVGTFRFPAIDYIDGVELPTGKLMKDKSLISQFLTYNEFIVYNEAQVKIRYLVKVRFNQIVSLN